MIQNNEDIREQANIARHVAIILAENIYKYIGNCITLNQLQQIVDDLISSDYTTRFKHQYILKDTYESTLSHMFMYDPSNDVCDEDESDTLIIEESDTSDWAKASHR